MAVADLADAKSIALGVIDLPARTVTKARDMGFDPSEIDRIG
jgi:hypothetical protein